MYIYSALPRNTLNPIHTYIHIFIYALLFIWGDLFSSLLQGLLIYIYVYIYIRLYPETPSTRYIHTYTYLYMHYCLFGVTSSLLCCRVCSTRLRPTHSRCRSLLSFRHGEYILNMKTPHTYIHPSFCLSIYRSTIYLYICLYISMIYIYDNKPMHNRSALRSSFRHGESIHIYIYILYIYPSNFLSIHLSIHLSVFV